MNGFFEKAFSILEFKKVLNILEKFAVCEETKSYVKNISPSLNFNEVENMINETDEAFVIFKRFGGLNIFDVKNPKEDLKKAKQGMYIECFGIFNIGNILKQLSFLTLFFEQYKENFKYLSKYFENLYINKELENLIFKKLISSDEIADDATDELRNIRNNIKKQNVKIRKILYGFINGEKNKYLQEKIATIREGRHVLAVKSENKKEIPGIIHDVSSSGSTVFLEPSVVVDADNELKNLYRKEKYEIVKILKFLTQKCLNFADEIIGGYYEILNLDLIFAKSKLGDFMKATKPIITTNGEISLKKARHPLIDSNVVVPVDIECGGKFKNLIVTGPNTGGKTVVLKTVGLLTIMTMCGMLIPALETSSVSVFSNVLVIIGDEQSIENSLSTFSAHIKNIVFMLSVVNNKSLVLIDELASGTDPDQGAALAVAVVEHICLKKATLIATTHYNELKNYALNKEYVKNACFEFDLKTLKPTYKLLMGVIGQSNAFEISKKLGLNEKIIDRSKHFMNKKALYLNNMLTELEKYRKLFLEKFALQKQYALKLKATKLKLEKEKENSNVVAKKNIERAKQQANELLNNIKNEANSILEELKKIKSKKLKKDPTGLINKTKSLIKKNIYSLYDYVNLEDEEEKEEEDEEFSEFKVGDLVFVNELGKSGKVLEEPNKSKKVLVLIGSIKIRVHVKKLKFLQKKPKTKQNFNISKNLIGKQNRTVRTEIDLRGLGVQEAMPVLDKFIDECVLNSLGVITIIHGKGTGVLKKAISKHLKQHPSVSSVRLGVYGEGEDGVTIVNIK